MKQQQMPDQRPHVVVIGSGFGGLAAAVRLGARGFRVTVCERLDAPGGRAYVFRRDGYTFDAGPTIITAPHLLEELWRIAGGRLADDVELRSLDPFYEIRFDDGTVLACSGDPAKMRAEVERIAPEDIDGLERYMASSARIYRTAFEELGHQPFHRLGTMLGAVPDMVRLGGLRSVHQEVARHFKSPYMRIAFSFHPLLIGGNPFSVTAYYCLIAHLERAFGVHCAMGGTGALVRGLAGLIARQGNTLRCEAEVDRIEVEGRQVRGVRLATGERIEADVVVSNADVAWTYSKLLGHVPRRRWTDRRLARANYSMGLFVWYFGTDRQWPEVRHHTMVLGPRYRELLDDIFHRHRLAEDFSLYLHRPTASDPSLAPPGCDAFYVLAPVPHLAADVDWDARAESYRAAIEQRLADTVLPGLGGHVVTSHVMTPKDFERRLLSVKGAGFSLEPRFLQSAWFRPHNVSEEVEGLYLVGAGTHPGAGLPGVLSSARVADALIPDAAYLRAARR